jgi:hypothetical protein
MKSKRMIFIGCLAAAALLASPVLGQPRHSGGRAMISPPHATAHAARNYAGYSGSRYGEMWHSGRHHHHGYGNSFYFYGYPYAFGWYPYYWGAPWGYDYGYNYYPYSYGYSYYGRPAYGYTSDSVVKHVQSYLADQGYYHGAVDGVIGPRTRAAISAYESRHGLSVDGAISNHLLSTMGLR